MTLTIQIDELLWDVHDNFADITYIENKRKEIITLFQQEIDKVENPWKGWSKGTPFENAREAIKKQIGG
jgi:hypothetical protein